MKSIFSIKRVFFCLAFFAMRANAQTVVDTSTIDKQLKYMIQPLNKSHVTTGFLAEQGTIFFGIEQFNGTLSSYNNFVPNLWRAAYVQFRESYCGSGANPLPDLIVVNDSLSAKSDFSLPIPIPILIGEYNYFKSDAITSNLLSYNSTTRQLHDVNNRPSSPYALRHVFAACPFGEYSDKGYESFIVRSDLLYNTTGHAISSVQVDFGNGQGYVTMPMNTPVNISYADTGYYPMNIKATLSNNSVFECSSEFYVVHKENAAARYVAGGVNGSFVPPLWGDIPAVAGVHSGGKIHVVLSSKSRSTQIRKPLIVVENMDAYKLAPQLQAVPYTVASFIREMDLIVGYDLNKELDEIAGYDLIFIDFNDGMDGIVRNAEVVKEAIIQINQNRALIDDRSGIREQNVVLGIGTGGLNARYALANMAKNFSGTPAETRLLITHDAPHRGSNIALSLQYLVKYINKSKSYSHNLGRYFPEHAQTVAFIDAPVNRDVLIYRAIVDQIGSVENSFIENIYQPMVTFTGTTQPFRFVTTSLGNECARPLFQPGRLFMHFGETESIGLKLKLHFAFLGIVSKKLDSLFGISIPLIESKYETLIYAKAIPVSSASDRRITLCTHVYKVILFAGLITLQKTGVNEEALAPSHFLPIDGVPGSFKTLLDFKELRNYANSIGNWYFSFSQKLASFPIIKGVVKGSIYGFFKASEYNSGVFSTQYTEVPVVSALDVSPFNSNAFTQYYVNGNNTNYPSSSNTFIAQETILANNLFNNTSRLFTARNSRFMFKEMENQINSENCSAECSNPFVLEGSDDFCTSATYRVRGVPRGVSFSWNVFPSTGLVSWVINPNDPTIITLTRIGQANGYVWLTANIGAGCSPATTLTKQIAVGSPEPIGVYFDTPDPICIDHRYPLGVKTVTVYPQLPGATYQWQVNGVTRNGNGAVFNIINSWCINGTNTIRVRAYRCDTWSNWSNDDFFEGTWCGTRLASPTYTISPNPVTDVLTVQTKDKVGMQEIRVKDKVGMVRRMLRLAKGSTNAKLDLFDLPADFYVVEIFNGSEWTSLKLLKK